MTLRHDLLKSAPAIRHRALDIEQLVTASFEAAMQGDASLVDSHVSLDDGVRLIGSDPTETFAGGPAVAAFLKDEVEGAGGHARFSPAGVEEVQRGHGWFGRRPR